MVGKAARPPWRRNDTVTDLLASTHRNSEPQLVEHRQDCPLTLTLGDLGVEEPRGEWQQHDKYGFSAAIVRLAWFASGVDDALDHAGHRVGREVALSGGIAEPPALRGDRDDGVIRDELDLACGEVLATTLHMDQAGRDEPERMHVGDGIDR